MTEAIHARFNELSDRINSLGLANDLLTAELKNERAKTQILKEALEERICECDPIEPHGDEGYAIIKCGRCNALDRVSRMEEMK